MSKQHTITLNGNRFFARSGEVLLDAALVNGVDLAHDCRAGRCGTCLTRVNCGITIGGSTRQPGMVHACQARVLSDLTLTAETLPPVDVTEGRVTRIVNVTEDVAELTIAPVKPTLHLPGQYYRFTFQGFPARAFSPTQPLDGTWLNKAFKLNIKRVRDGRVSQQIGKAILPGHRVSMLGPFGHAFLRPNHTNRLVLIGGGTGFAPIWAVAQAALRENPSREIWLVGGVRKCAQLYMIPALQAAGRLPNVTVVASVESPDQAPAFAKIGTPDSALPQLRPSDTVYAAGSPVMVDAVAAAASEVGAMFYSDPFEAARGADNGELLTKIGSWIKAAVTGQR